MIVATYITQLLCMTVGIGTGVTGLSALFDGQFVTGTMWLLVSVITALGEHLSRRLRDNLAERDRLG